LAAAEGGGEAAAEGDGGGAGGGSTLIPVPVATILVHHCRCFVRRGCGSSRRSESLFAAPAARSDHPEGASRFRGAGACSAQWSPTSSSSGHVADLSLVLRRTWALVCAQAVKPPVPTPGLHLQQQRAVVVGGMRAAGFCRCRCELVRLFLPKFRCGATVAAFS
jgi:hypothetical protein